ncbi:MAG: hypothetical protein Kow001_05210 [Acidobacteriota bacterium]
MQTFANRSFVCVVVAGILTALLPAQSTGGYNVQRTNLNPDAGILEPPLELVRTLTLPADFEGETFAVHNGFLVIGEGGPTSRYILLDEVTGAVNWTVALPGSAGALNYSPAFGNDLVLLGSEATSTVTAVRLSTGDLVWQDTRVGSATGRHPFLSPGLALYHGSRSLAAVSPETGLAFWRFPSTASSEEVSLARAPVAAYGDQVLVLHADGTLRAISLLTGRTRWTIFNVGSDGSSLIPTPETVFLQHSGSEAINAVDLATGSLVWTREVEAPFGTPALAYAYGRLYAFLSRDGKAAVAAFDPDTGDLLWEYIDPSDAPGIAMYGVAADNLVYFYNPGSERIRILDAFTGGLRWSRREPGVRGLAVDRAGLYALFADEVRIFEASHTIYLAHLADGQGASTLFTIVNLGLQTAEGELEFFASDGTPLNLVVEGGGESLAVVPFTIPPAGSVKVQTAGVSEQLTSGWARATASQPIRGTSVFQFSDGAQILFEAGVADSPASNLAGLFASRASLSPASPFSTGVAIANPSDEATEVRLVFRRQVPTEGVFLTTLTLGPGEHLAQFLEEMFGTEAELGSEGTLIVSADVPVVVTALRTQSGYQMSSYPVGVPIR